MAKKLLSLILALAMVIAMLALVACGGEPVGTTESTSATTESTGKQGGETDPSSSETSATASSETEGTTASTEESTSGSGTTGPTVISSDDIDGREKHPDYQDVNFGGREFVFLTQKIDDWDCYEIKAELTGNDTILDEAIAERNSIVESKYSCKITALEGENRAALIETDVSTGQHNYDFLLYQYTNSTANKNYLNIANLDIDLTHDWWDQKFIDCFGLDVDGTKRLYTISGQFNLISYDAIWGLYMNRTVYDQLRATGTITDDIYDLIRGGNWTIDAMDKMMTEAAQDADGNSVISYNEGKDRIGCTTYNNGCAEVGFFFGVGGRGAIRNETTGLPEAINADNYPLYNELQSRVQKVMSMVKGGKPENGALYQPISGDDVTASFTNGRTLFISECLDAATRSTDENANYTIIPFPKYNPEQEDYIHYVCVRAYGLKVSAAAAADANNIANFLEVFAFHSKQIVYPAYVTYFTTQVFKGEESADMFDLVLRTKTYDFDYFAGGGQKIVNLCSQYIANNKDTGYARAIVASANSVNETFANYVNDLRKLTY
ncbi:MAG: hypothetical protein KBS76_04250 [Ruminococcus sp.]|nr:hypothetical protein [Candidatus Apopatosoma intestinale]